MGANFTKMVSNSSNKDSKNQILQLDPAQLIDDPDNHEIYSNYEVTLLAEDMKRNGIIGTIIAYPYHGKYRIEAGHRRKYAAIQAGITRFPVLISQPPKDDLERRKRLVRANLHVRNYSPMTYAREAQYMYETYEKEKEELVKSGKKPDFGSTDLVANDLEISSSQVSRYRTLLKLSPDLQKLIDETKNIPWGAFCEAASLTEEQQKALYTKICGTIKAYGQESVTSSFIRKTIEECMLIKGGGYSFDRSALERYEPTPAPEEKGKKVRRINGASALKKSSKNIRDCLDYEKAFIKSSQKEDVLDELKELSNFINEQIQKIEQDGFPEEFDRKIK